MIDLVVVVVVLVDLVVVEFGVEILGYFFCCVFGLRDDFIVF
jgi:hypothetical protein